MDKNHAFYLGLFLSAVSFVHIDCQFANYTQNDSPQNGSKEPRIIGGVKAEPGVFLGMVSIQSNLGKHSCGGTLISPTVVLTAAHCAVDLMPRSLLVMGDDLQLKDSAGSRRQIRNIRRIAVHEEYDPEIVKNDIALLIVKEPFVETDTFKPINVTDVGPADDELCRIGGWGKVNAIQSSNDLMALNLTVIPMSFCNSTWSYDGHIPQGQFCAGFLDGGRDACQGDSGGGLMCGDVVKGIVSWGNDCAIPNFPGVYTDVYQYRDWIKKNSGSSIAPLIAMTMLSVALCGMTIIQHLV